jgi:selenide,water dikinase
MRDVGPVCEIVLLGGGHAHVEALRRFARRPLTGVRLSLVSRERRTPYSGMLPGVIRGDYAASEAHVDLAPLADACGARLVLSAAAGIDLAARRVLFADRQPVAFDLLSLDVGGEPAAAQGGIPVKPIGRLLDRLAELERVLEPGDRVAVVGAGAGGTELALALATRLRVALICAEAEPLAGAPRAVRAAVRGRRRARSCCAASRRARSGPEDSSCRTGARCPSPPRCGRPARAGRRGWPPPASRATRPAA